MNAFRYTDALTVEKSAFGTDESIRHTYAEPENVTTLGAEFIADAPANINLEVVIGLMKSGLHLEAHLLR